MTRGPGPNRGFGAATILVADPRRGSMVVGRCQGWLPELARGAVTDEHDVGHDSQDHDVDRDAGEGLGQPQQADDQGHDGEGRP